jgi:isoleucyl-tRNA synthetase
MLSNWYVRLSRRRFWKSESDDDKASAYATLYEALTTVAKLIAPTMPFLSEALYRNLVISHAPKATESVHLVMFPDHDPALIDQTIIDEMRLVQELVSLGRAARETVKIGVRQPLAKALFAVRPQETATVERLAGLLGAELNVKQVDVMRDAGDIVSYKLGPKPNILGKKFGKAFPKIQKAMKEGDPATVRAYAETLLRGETVTLTLDGVTYSVAPEEVEIWRQSAEGYAIAESNGYVAALDTTLTDDLILEGLAREVVRRVQSMRKDADFAITDHIVVQYSASERLARAIQAHADSIRTETLAAQLLTAETVDGFRSETFEFDGETLTLGVKRTT